MVVDYRIRDNTILIKLEKQERKQRYCIITFNFYNSFFSCFIQKLTLLVNG